MEEARGNLDQFRAALTGPEWTHHGGSAGSDPAPAATYLRRWQVRGAPVRQELSYVVDARSGDFLAIDLEFAGLRFRLASRVPTGPGDPTGRTGQGFQDTVRLLAEVPEDLRPGTARQWLDRVRRSVPLSWIGDDGGWKPLGGGPDDPDGRTASAGSGALLALLSDDPFAHPVGLAYYQDGYEVVDTDRPAWARARRVLARAGWEHLPSGTFVLGAGLDLRYDNGTGALDAGWVNDGLWLYVSFPETPGRPAVRHEFQVCLDGDLERRTPPAAEPPHATPDLTVVDRVLRLLLDRQDGLDPDGMGWFVAELAVVAPGTTRSSAGTTPEPLPPTPAPPPIEVGPAGALDRAAIMAKRLGEAGWRPATAPGSPLLTSLCAMEVVRPSGAHWRCGYVLTGYPELPEALCLRFTDGDGGEPFEHHADLLVDVCGVADPPFFALVGQPARRLTDLLDRLAPDGDATQALSAAALIGGLLVPAGRGGLRCALSLQNLDRRPARSLSVLAAAQAATAGLADTGEFWLEAGFAADAAGRWNLAATAFREASRRGAGEGLADLWLGALLRYADPAGARAAFERAASGRDPALALRLLAHVLTAAGDRDGGLAALGRAADLAPDDWQTCGRYGLTLAKAGRPAEALGVLGRAIDRNDHPRLRWYRGYAHLLAGDREAALSDLVAAARTDPSLAKEIHDDPDLAELRGDPGFDAVLAPAAFRQQDGQQRLRALLLAADGWRESDGEEAAEGALLRWDDDFEGAIFTVSPIDEDGRVVLDIDDGVSGFLMFRVEVGGDPEPFANVLRRWPEEFTDEDAEGWVDVGALLTALDAVYPGGLAYLQFGAGWVPVSG
jgi:tetratricopeptide (TPR) repeat protein